MAITDTSATFITSVNKIPSNITSIGIGPGIGTSDETRKMLAQFFKDCSLPMIIDADALNILAGDKDLLQRIPAGSILTPHPKEFERLFGKTANEFERIQMAQQKSVELDCIIILKGHHTFIATPRGIGYFNNTGNAGMATGGSGDVLTGILTGLRAQGYSSHDAALLGVYLHGLAGDMAAERLSKEAMIAGDITDHLSYAFLSLTN
jgi:NAD(P)H-hydrate epimerase